MGPFDLADAVKIMGVLMAFPRLSSSETGVFRGSCGGATVFPLTSSLSATPLWSRER